MSAARALTGLLLFAALAGAILLHAFGLISARRLDEVSLLPVAWAIYRLGRSSGQQGAIPALAGMAAAAGLAALQFWLPSLRYMPYLAVVPVNAFLACLFARGLLPGREPVLLRLITLIGRRPVDDPRFRRFVAWQCAAWSLLTLMTAVVAAMGMVLAAGRPELEVALGWLIALQLLLFATSHSYARLRYDRPETCWDTLRAILRPELWSKLRA